MERKIINPWQWQDVLGFVQAVKISGEQRSLICAGQTAMSAEGLPQHPGDMAAQLNMALDNLETILQQSSFKLSDIVRPRFKIII